MAIPTSCRIAFSFTALFFMSCTTTYAIILKHGRVSLAGHVVVTLIIAGLAAVSIYSAQSHEPTLDRAIDSLLCAAIGAGLHFKFEVLIDALRKSDILPLRAWIYVYLTRALVILTCTVLVMLAIGYGVCIFIGILFLQVGLGYATFSMVPIYLHFRFLVHLHSQFSVQNVHTLSVSLVSLVFSVLAFYFEDLRLSGWLLWSLLLLISFPIICLLGAYEATKPSYTNDTTGYPLGSRSHPQMHTSINCASMQQSEKQSIHGSEETSCGGGQGTPKELVSGESQTSYSCSSIEASSRFGSEPKSVIHSYGHHVTMEGVRDRAMTVSEAIQNGQTTDGTRLSVPSLTR